MNPYAAVSARALVRVLSGMDRDRTSPTYGCLDRAFWHYKTLVEFPSATFQEAALGLVFALDTPFEGNVCYRREEALDWARAAIRFWTRAQRRDGSVDEWFAREHSFVGTAFTTYAIAEAALRLGDRLAGEDAASVDKALERAARWIERHDNPLVTNQRCGAAAALAAVARRTGRHEFERSSREALDAALERFDREEGWFPEYGGADLGYLSVAVTYLARMLDRGDRSDLDEVLDRAVRFTGHLQHPDGGVGGPTGSRKTQYLLPAGFEILAGRGHRPAATVAARHGAALATNRTLGPDAVDDRYLAFFFASNYLEAVGRWEDRTFEAIKFEDRDFPRAGVVVFTGDRYRAIVSRRSHGAIEVHAIDGDRERQFAHYGYRVRYPDGVWAASQGPSEEVPSGVERKAGRCELWVEAPFYEVDQGRPLERFVVPFKLYTSTVAASDAVAQRLGRWLKEGKILRRRNRPLTLERRIHLDREGVRVIDRFTAQDSPPVEILAEGRASTLHVPSSRFFVDDDLGATPPLPDGAELVARLAREGRFDLEYRMTFGNNGPDLAVRFV